ncbi:MAG: MazG nucleotide pyrophosphohydrolase domain-containing protein [archaeon]
MKEAIIELYDFIKLCDKRSEWMKQMSVRDRIQELKKETEELIEAFDNNDVENVKEELGDVLWDALSLMVMAERDEIIKGNKAIRENIQKIKDRMPWLAEDRHVSVEEELRVWNEIKKEQKNK